MRRLLARASGLAALVALAVPVQAAAEPALLPGFQDEVVFSGLEQPVNFRFAPDGRVFVAEKPGRIKVFDSVNDTTPTLFADLRGDVYDNGDRGLLGLALDPKFDEGRPYVYALYTWDHVLGEPWNNLSPTPKYGKPEESGDPDCPTQNNTKSCLVSGRLVVLEEDEAKPGHAVTEGGLPKEKQLLEGWCQQFNSHSIGELQFGPEGALYVSGGDGASYESIADYGQLGPPIGEANPCGDPPTAKGVSPKEENGSANPESQGGALRSLNLKLLNGAILRVDPDTGAPLPDNPLAGNGNVNAERTVAKGFRNPFRFALDEGTGEIYSGNVGSSEIEEIDRFAAPPASVYNSGWPCYEGIERQFRFKVLGLNVCSALYKAEEEEKPQTAEPFFTYSHSQTVVPDDECPFEAGSAISGVSLYEGSQFPAAYEGALFFGDAVRGCIWVMEAGGDGKPDPSTAKRFLREGSVYAGVKIAEGPGEFLYYASLFSEEGKGEGEIHRIAYKPNSPVARVEGKPPHGLYNGSGKFETTVDASKSSDPNGDPLTYEWDLNEDGVFEISGSAKTQPVTYTEAEQLTREGEEKSPNRVVTVRVEDDENLSSVARITIYPGDKPPTVTITEPTSLQKWKVGDLVKLEGAGFDQGDPSKEISSPRFYYWETRMAHCPDPSNPTACHEHPLQTFAGIRRPELIAPQHDYPSYIKVLLRVSDERGLQGTATLKFQPETANLSLSSNPPGIELLGANTEAASPFTVQAIIGSEIQLAAPQTATIGGVVYTFSSWSDGGAREHPILVSAGQTGYTANYTGGPPPPPPPEEEKEKPVPNTKIVRHPPAKTAKTKAAFSFSSTVSGSTFACRLDGKPKAGCGATKTYKKLKPGKHTLKVWASAGGKTDPTPAKFSWKVLPPKR
ncbi:MAG TPA: PQQ-dependent sugar dehydrogenase [Solirubrobacterales bacterium]|nr:PQQ-dependent sugar dehydrogenase [Solirubrobacterales bacterium]